MQTRRLIAVVLKLVSTALAFALAILTYKAATGTLDSEIQANLLTYSLLAVAVILISKISSDRLLRQAITHEQQSTIPKTTDQNQ